LNIELTLTEKYYLNEILTELKQYQISSKDRKKIKQQILEHIQESREHAGDSINELGDATTFVKDYLEINGIDLHSQIKKIRKSKSRTGMFIVMGCFTSIVTYFISQLILSMYLTKSFNPLNTDNSFDYNIFYRISDNPWWNSLLIIISISISLLVTVLIVLIYGKKSK